MKGRPKWILLEYGSEEMLNKSILNRDKRLLFYPAVGTMQLGKMVDLQISLEGSNVLFPIEARVVDLRERPGGKDKPSGVILEVIEADRFRFDRLCAFVDGVWQPGMRRAETRLPAAIRASYYYPERFYPAETLNISDKGMFLRTTGPLPKPGQGVFVRLRPSRLRRPIGLKARVCWVDHVESRRGMGLLCMAPPRGLEQLRELIDKIKKKMKI